MDALKIQGGATLSGKLLVSGSKNASLPIMTAALLAPGTSVLHRVPDLADVKTLSAVLVDMGMSIERHADALHLNATQIIKPEAPYDLVRTMRASFLVLGPLLARLGRGKVSLPGGCAIGARPVDQHLKGLQCLGAQITLEHGYVIAEAPRGLIGAEVNFDVPTVGGTENLMLAASCARGDTILRNCAREPEIVDLANALIAMGADIQGAGEDNIRIRGKTSLHPFDYTVMPDRIEFGTFLVAGALAGKQLQIHNGKPAHQSLLLEKLRTAGAHITVDGDVVTLNRVDKPAPLHIETEPYPGFPTDMQAQLMALMAVSSGDSVVSENIFENRFMHVAELSRLGASIRVEGGIAFVHGVPKLSGTSVMATDLRASACLVLAGLIAEGETLVRRIYHLDRGYEHIEQKLRSVGAQVERYRE